MMTNVLSAIASQAIRLLTSLRSTMAVGEPIFWAMGHRKPGRDIDLMRVRNVLVTRVDEIGDVAMTTPFLRELRRNLPGAWITLVVKPAVHNLVECCPYVNEVRTYEWRASGRSGGMRLQARAVQLASRHLWRRRFDLAILPRWDVDSYHGAFLNYLSGARWRVGYSENVNLRKKSQNGGLDRLFTHVTWGSDPRHEVQRNLDIIHFLGGKVADDRLEAWCTPEDDEEANRVLLSHGCGMHDLLLAINPGAGSPRRMWPLERFSELGSRLTGTFGVRVVIIGGPGEQDMGREIGRHIGSSAVDLVGCLTLRQVQALLKRCRLFVGNDSGPMHLAATVGTPVIEISCHPLGGSPNHVNSPVRFGPWGVRNIVIRPEHPTPPCSEGCCPPEPHCILGVSVPSVLSAVANLISAVPDKSIAQSNASPS